MSDDKSSTPMKTPKIDMGVFMGIYHDTIDEGMSSTEAYDIAMSTCKALQEMKDAIKEMEKVK